MIAVAERRGTLNRAKPLPRLITGPRAFSHPIEESPEQIAERIRTLVEAGRVVAARELLAKLPAYQREVPSVARWARALALPIVRIGSPGTTENISANAVWIREHGQTYANHWVALRNGILVSSHSDELTLRRSLEGRNELADVVFVCLRPG